MHTRSRLPEVEPAANGRPGAVVVLSGARRTFGGETGLAGLSLTVHPGSVTVLVGPNGAGKTTALRAITGALTCEAGSVRVFGVDPSGTEGEHVRRRCGVVAAKPALYDRLTGRDNLRFAAELFGLGTSAPIVESAARFRIDSALDLRVGGYSTGMKTRLALARAVLHDPDLLLLDEPTSGLDPESSRAVLDLVDAMAAGGKTVVMSTHLLLEAEGLADEVVLMEDGEAVMAGAPRDLVMRFWPHPRVTIETETGETETGETETGEADGSGLESLEGREGVLGLGIVGSVAEVELDDVSQVPALVAHLVSTGSRVMRVTPHEPSLEDLYLRVRHR